MQVSRPQVQFLPVDDITPAIYRHSHCPQRSHGIQQRVCG